MEADRRTGQAGTGPDHRRIDSAGPELTTVARGISRVAVGRVLRGFAVAVVVDGIGEVGQAQPGAGTAV